MLEVLETAEFKTWLKELRDRRGAMAVVKRLNRVRDGNFGDAEPVGEGVSELRLHLGPGYRVYVVKVDEETYVAMLAGTKGSQDRDIEKALKWAREIRENGYEREDEPEDDQDEG
jgi:putative addiction module killer protein